MSDYSNHTFTLDNSLAAVSAYVLEGTAVATDGTNCCVHIISQGSCAERVSTLRPYRRLRRDAQSGRHTAIGCNGRILYHLNSKFRECGYTELDLGCNCGCTSRCGCNCTGNTSGDCTSCLTDAMSVYVGRTRFIVGAFSHSAYLFDINGKRLGKLCETNTDEYLENFISFGSDRYAMSTICGRTQTVTVSDNQQIHSALLDDAFVLRMLFSEDDTVYGLFGRNYIYNTVIPIYSQGNLTLPTLENSSFTC